MKKRDLEKDLAKMFSIVTERTEKIAGAKAAIDRKDPINMLSLKLHPAKIILKVAEIRQETDSSRTYRLINADTKEPLPYFRAGQYISLKPVVNQVSITRPYSIASAPNQSDSYYEITINYKPGGFFSDHVWEDWKVGTLINADGPHGNFYYEPLRDKKKIVALAGGSGITPFRSLILEALGHEEGPQIILLYGSRHEDEIIYRDELDALALKNPDKLKVVHVISEPTSAYSGRKGLITSSLIEEFIDEPTDYSYFVCGPEAMYRHCLSELAFFQLPPRLIRLELSGSSETVFEKSDYPGEKTAKNVNVTYNCGTARGTLEASTAEPLLVSFERAGLAPQSQCRSGECGFCRALLRTGEVYIRKDRDGRRAADLEYNYIHPCSSYPLTDLDIDII